MSATTLTTRAGILMLALTFLPSGAFAANDALVKLLGILRDRGSITAEEYRELVVLADPAAAAATTAQAAPVVQPVTPTAAGPEALAARVAALEDANRSGEAVKKALGGRWYERMKFGGYTQFRVTEVQQGDGGILEVPNDRSVKPAETFLIRRGRLRYTGDVTPRFYLYAQTDFNGSPGSGDFGLQARDLYADIALDRQKAWRVRAGLSKVPFGFSNMQSSSNRLALERPEAINSAVEGERDYGAYLMWASPEARRRFSDLTSKGLRGSGDYGVVAVGLFNGQGLNRPDADGAPYVLGRVSYPFKTASGQLYELGVQAYHGMFVPETQAVVVNGASIVPSRPEAGVADDRIGTTFVLYPQPFGIEAEWNWGRGPQIAADFRSITAQRLQGGYLQGSYRHVRGDSVYTPFVRWQYFDGARKFGRNAPWDRVNETEAGFEWEPVSELELTFLYGRTAERVRTGTFPYATTRGANRFSLQLQVNY